MSVLLQILAVTVVIVAIIAFRIWSDREIQRQRGGCGQIGAGCSHKREGKCSRRKEF